MKKRDLLFAGALLIGVTAFAQGPTLDPEKDAKVIFTQTFEDDWDHWQATPVDTIKVIEYYDHAYEGNKAFSRAWESPDSWKRGIFRTDSVTPGHEGGIMMFNGVKVADNLDESGRFWRKDDYRIQTDDSPERAAAFDLFGEDGGDKVFWYKADSCGESNGYSPEYRRNLFVRGLDIQDNTSYRLTFYVKAKSVAGKTASPRMRAGILRGFFRSEKPFSMGLENDNSHYKYNVPLQYEKTDFTGDWEKVTYMTYYLNDSIADYYCLDRGYWWAEDSSWYWKSGSLDSKGNAIDKDLFYVVQPDKSWVRLSFSSDFTEFWLDNLSLTRSWIGGCEYNNDKMRVDFGYRTNMDTLVMNNKKITGIDQLEIPNTGENEGKYVTVWCLDQDDKWTKMPIRSAEYHADGYMYIFTQYVTIPGPGGTTQDVALKFGDYKQVLVSFNNPVDKPNLTLKYRGTGKTPSSGDISSPDVVFPNALDTTWIKNDRIVFDFSNEIATPNPSTKAWANVHSLADLPPVMVKAPFEDGAFGITPTNEIKFKFSRQVQFDNLNTTTKAIAYVGTERWKLSWSSADSMLVLSRDVNKEFAENASANVTAPLAGDYVITIENIAGKGTDKGANVKFTYHFGSFNRDNAAGALIASDWRSEIVETGAWDRPMPASLWCYDKEDGFYGGEGKNYSPYKKCGLYKMKDDGKNGNALFYLSGRVNDNYGSLYTVEHMTPGDYRIAFSSFGWSRQNDIKVYLYAKPAGEMAYGTLSTATKTTIGTYKPAYQTSWSGNNTEESWNAAVERFSFSFNVATEGDYVIEWETPKEGSQSYYGVAIGNYTITPDKEISSLYLSALTLNNAVKAAQGRVRLASANTAIYSGVALTKLNAKVEEYVTGGSFDEGHAVNQEPSIWAEAAADINKYTNWLSSRMDTIDTEQAKLTEANTKVASLSAQYKLFDVSAKLQALIDSATNKFPIPEKSGNDIAAMTTALDNAIKAVDARADKNDNLASLITAAEKAFNAKERTDFEEYDVLGNVVTAAKAFDAITAADADVDEQINNVTVATNKYLFRIEGVKAQTERLRAFRDLASELKVEAVDTLWAIKNFVDTVQTDNDEIADIYKAAVKYAILNMVATNKFEDEIDITPFIKNYNLYATPKYSGVIEVLSNADTCKKIGANGENIINVGHEHTTSEAADAIQGHKPIWIMVQENDITTLWPGWTVKGYATGNRMYTPDNTGEEGYTKLSIGAPVFDGAVAMDWNGKADIKTTVSDLPAGIYQFGVNLVKHQVVSTGWGASTKTSTFTITSKIAGKDSVLKATNSANGRAILAVDSVTVLNDTAQIFLELQSNNGWSMADNFSVTYLAKHKSVNYADEAAKAKTVMETKITSRKTFVNAPKAAANRVEFYNAGGQKVNAPKSGLYIKVENGVATKVFVK